MAWLPDREKKLKICLFVLTESTNVTDRHADRHRMSDGTAEAALMHGIARSRGITDELWPSFNFKFEFTFKIFSM